MKNRMKRILIYLILTSLSALSCQKIFFNKDESTRELSLKDFHIVKISGIYNIVLIQDSTNRLVITGQNDINSIDAVMDEDTLVIDNNKKISLNPNKNTLAIHFTNLEYMVTYDPVSVSNRDTLKANWFLYEAFGEIAEVSLVMDCYYFRMVNSANTLGSFYLKGKAHDCAFSNHYGSSIFADSLFCKNAEIYNESIGDIYVNASQKIIASIRGSGNIYYHGNPSIEIAEQKGDGKIIPLD
jgi:hypothetical protein